MMEGHKIKIQIADIHGFTQYMLNPAETMEMLHNLDEGWIYADNQLVQADQVDEANITRVSSVRILPALVNGPAYSPHGGEEE